MKNLTALELTELSFNESTQIEGGNPVSAIAMAGLALQIISVGAAVFLLGYYIGKAIF